MKTIKNKISIGIDQSITCSGIVILNDNKLQQFHTIETTKQGFPDPFDRVEFIGNEIISICSRYMGASIQIEGLSFGSHGDATRTLAGLQFHIILSLRKIGFNPIIIPPTTLKKLATGKGTAKKEQMIEALPEDVYNKFYDAGHRLKARKKDLPGLADLADAYWLARNPDYA